MTGDNSRSSRSNRARGAIVTVLTKNNRRATGTGWPKRVKGADGAIPPQKRQAGVPVTKGSCRVRDVMGEEGKEARAWT